MTESKARQHSPPADAAQEASAALVADGSPVVLRAENLTKSYADGQVVALKNVNLSIPRGDYLAVVGKSGSGKSTLLNMLGGLDRPTSGEVYFGEQPLSRLPSLERFRSKHIGFVFQSFYLLPVLSVAENVQIPMFETRLSLAERRERAAELLELVGLSERAKHTPRELSVGERQRVAIARALANRPEIILADEPTGNLDSVTAAGIIELFERMHREERNTLVLITHDRDLARRAHRIVRMHDAELSEETP